MSFLDTFKAEFEKLPAEVKADASAEWAKVVAVFEGEETKFQAALKTIEAKGYMVIEKVEADVLAETPVIKLVTAAL